MEAIHDYSKVRDVLKDLGAEMGKVCTRFPPEPSGYLHIGHIKASMLNYHYAKMYQGTMILRFDDTNPTAEKIEFVENIIADLKTLHIVPDRVTFSSDYFEQIQNYCRQLIIDNNAYADDTPALQMKEEREKMIESKHRQNTVEQNLQHFEDMLSGKSTNFCIRAKLNMADKVGCLRDPVFYRCKDTPHHRTGTTYKAYPTYDLTVPIVDSLEGVTHALRTIEYRDRNALYAWVQKVLNLRPVKIYDFSKLCMASTVLSKRKLNWFVNEKIVEGWNDCRFPTVQGIMRKGMTVEALKEFMLEQGPSQNNNLMEWDKIWANNKKVIDPIAPRYTCVSKESACRLFIENGPLPVEGRSQPLHPKNDVGTKATIYGRELLIEKEDAAEIQEGEKITLMKWGNATVSRKVVDGESISLYAVIDEADTDFKKTKKVTWLCNDPATTVEIKLVEYAHLIDKQKIEENDDIEKLVNRNSKQEYSAIAEGSVRTLQKGAIIQFERRGFYIVDQVGLTNQQISCIFIPDGKAKAMSSITQKIDAQETQKGKGAIADKKTGGKAAAVEGEEVKLSKKDLAKLAKKEKKADAKDNAKTVAKPTESKKEAAQPKTAPQAVAQQSNVDLNALEATLSKQQWLGGALPTQADATALASLAGVTVIAASHPNTFSWHMLASKFSPQVQQSWK